MLDGFLFGEAHFPEPRWRLSRPPHLVHYITSAVIEASPPTTRLPTPRLHINASKRSFTYFQRTKLN